MRGVPRNKENIKYVENIVGGKLVHDTEPDLIRQLDLLLLVYRKKHNKMPDFISLPNERDLYMPIPYEINVGGVKAMMQRKPAWFRIKRSFVVGGKSGNSSSK